MTPLVYLVVAMVEFVTQRRIREEPDEYKRGFAVVCLLAPAWDALFFLGWLQ